MPAATQNMFLQGSLSSLFLRTAAPIVLIMTINGLYVIADAYFLGLYAGSEALSAVTLIFPGMMMLYAMQTLVSNGMASILARELGGGRRAEATKTFSGAHVLATIVVAVMMAFYFTLAAPSSTRHRTAHLKWPKMPGSSCRSRSASRPSPSGCRSISMPFAAKVGSAS